MKAIRGQIIMKMDVTQKMKYRLTDDVTIQIEKGYNFNLREDRSSMGYVIDGDSLPVGAKLLCHHLSIEESYRIWDESILTEEEKKEGFKVFSIPIDMAFCYMVENEWVPCKNFLITKRIFKPYNGVLVGIEPKVVKNRLFILKGVDEWDGEVTDLSNKVCIVTENSDYQIIWHDTDNREYSLIRTRHRELMGVDEGMTNQVKSGTLLVGYTVSDCEKLN